MTTLNREPGTSTRDTETPIRPARDGIVQACPSRPATDAIHGAFDELVAPGLVREVRLMVDGRRISYYRRVCGGE